MGTRFPHETLRYAKDLPREGPGQVALDCVTYSGVAALK